MVGYCLSQGAGSLAVDNAYTGQMRNIGIIQIFVESGNGLVASHAEQIDLCRNRETLGHFDLGALRAQSCRDRDFLFPGKGQITDVYFGFDNTALHEQVALAVRQGGHIAFDPQRMYFYLLTESEVFGGQRAGRLGLRLDGKLGIFLGYFLADLLTLLFHLLHRSGISVLVKIADSLIGYILGLLQDVTCFLVGLL